MHVWYRDRCSDLNFVTPNCLQIALKTVLNLFFIRYSDNFAAAGIVNIDQVLKLQNLEQQNLKFQVFLFYCLLTPTPWSEKNS